MSINKKNKSNSSLTSASSILSNALKLRKDKLPIQTIMEGQNATPIDDKAEEPVNVVPSPLELDQKSDTGSVEVNNPQELKTVGEGEPFDNVKAVSPGEEKENEKNAPEPEEITTTPKIEEIVKKEEQQPIEAVSPPNEKNEEVATDKQSVGTTKKEKQKAGYQRFLIANRSVQKGKAIYIRTAYHEKIENIISTMGSKGLSLTAYIDNVLTAHFEQHEDVIRELQQEKLKEYLKQLER
ncbi:hypothetical protein AAKU52_002626 [Pedobacter sp. CG_S7]|uniref:DUF3408 domain-containing protein n=1 Tax=Pedobacter sp. CG_S7 TaxID=3143930 RepID=UPI00339440AD